MYAPPVATEVGLTLPSKLVSVQVGADTAHLLPSQLVPEAQVAVAVAVASWILLLFKKKLLELYGTEAEKLVPEFPVVIIVLALGVLEVILDVPTALVVVQESAVSQLLAPEAIVQLEAVRVPVVGAGQLMVFGLAVVSVSPPPAESIA